MRRVAMAFAFIVALYAAQNTPAGDPKDFADSKFMREAASGGMLEVKLGGLAAERAENGEVRDFGKRLVADHSKANTELLDLAKKKGVVIAKELNKTHQGHFDKFNNMKSGPEFDRALVKHMVKDHEEDAAEFAKQGKEAKDSDVRAFAQKTLPVIQEHLRTARTLSANSETRKLSIEYCSIP